MPDTIRIHGWRRHDKLAREKLVEPAGIMALLFAVVAISMPPAPAQPAKYPHKPIRLIVPFPPRQHGRERAGASGIIGTGLVAHAE